MSHRARVLSSLMAVLLLSSGCATIRQGDVGVKRTLGKIDDEAIGPGLRV